MSLLAELHEMPVPAPTSGSRWAVPFLHPTRTSTALITPERTLDHDELAVRVAAVVERLPDVATGRRLVHLPLTEHLDDVVGYLAVLAAGHVALVTGPQALQSTSVTDRFAPDVRLAGADVEVLSPDAQRLLHPDLALLLSTSGSTGSPKLVRLTHDNLAANAHGIATALELDADDRAITSLPLHYCYGLSVLHSVLLVGGSVVLTDHSVTDERFWRLQAEHRATLFAGVPHTFDLVGSRLRGHLPGLRLVTQAGGAMAPDRVTEIAETGRAKGWQLAVMYGQTEATARMAVLHGRDVLAHPDSVGAPIADSSFRIDHDVPGGTDEVGELVFTGPGVMLGYAEHPDELALGRMVTELRTGDLGRIGDDGLVRIVGRRDQVAKVMGLRIDLGQVCAAITASGHDVVVTADAQRLLVTLVADPAAPGTRESAREVRDLAADASGLQPGSVVVAPIAGLPRLANGKTDRAGCRRHALDHAERADDTADGDRLGATVDIVASALGRDDIDADRSFTELGGDSYSLVQTSVRLEKVLGPLPSDWHRVPLTELVRTTSGRTGAISWLETPVVLRAAAVLAICASHIGLVSWPGGAHTLLVVAGWAMARFTLVSSDPAEHRRRGIRAVVALVVPSVLVALAVRLAGGGYDWANVFLVNWLVGTVVSDGPRVQLWFIEALLACIVLVLALMAVPATRRAYLRSPWAWSMGLAGLALVPRYLLIPDPTGSISGLPGSVLWLFAVGMALGVATTRRQHLAALALTAVGMVGFFFDPTRGATVLAAVVVLALVPRIPLPRLLAPLTGLLATASLHIYLVQFRIYPYIDNGLIALVLSLAAGVAAWALLHPPTRALTELIAPTTPRHRHRHPEDTPCVVAP